MLSSSRVQSFVLGALGIALFVAAWEAIGVFRLAGLTWPPLTTVLAFMFDPSRIDMFSRASSASFSMAGLGYVTGTLSGVLLASIVHLLPRLRPGLDRLASVIHAVPPIALAPLFIVLIDRNYTGMAIALLNVFFIVYVATTSGLNNSTASHRALFQVLGAKPSTRLLLLDMPAALPAAISGMKYAVPAACIGAILGEWFGSSRGLGLILVTAMQNFQIPLLWSAVLLASAGSLAAFGAMGLLEKLVYRRFN